MITRNPVAPVVASKKRPPKKATVIDSLGPMGPKPETLQTITFFEVLAPKYGDRAHVQPFMFRHQAEDTVAKSPFADELIIRERVANVLPLDSEGGVA